MAPAPFTGKASEASIPRRIGSTTSLASNPAPMLQIAITSNTAVHVPVTATRTLARGTTRADVPFAV